MAIGERRMTLEEFLALPDEEPALEYEADGTVKQKVSPKGQHSALQGGLLQLINAFAQPRQLAFALPELRTVYSGAAYVPDVAVYRWDRIPRTADGKVANDFREPPDIAVEIVSPEQGVNWLLRKCLWYVEHGVAVALLIDPVDESVLLFRQNANPRPLTGSDPVDLGELLPGFSVTVEEIFNTLRP
jgi:Uma2 family endonuclease